MIAMEEQLLAEAIRDQLAAASATESRLAHLAEGNTLDNVGEGSHADELADASEALRWHLASLYRHIVVLAERLGLPRHAEETVRARDGFADLASMEPTPWDVHPVSPALEAARQLFQPMETMMLGGRGTALGILERILRGTAAIVARAGVSPKRERDVVLPVVDLLTACFPDVVGEGEILQAGRKVRCDVAVESLRAAIEFKFVDAKADVRPVLDGVLADVSNYGDDPRWRSRFAVIYQTEGFIDEAELTEKVRKADGRATWTVILVEQLPASAKPRS